MLFFIIFFAVARNIVVLGEMSMELQISQFEKKGTVLFIDKKEYLYIEKA